MSNKEFSNRLDQIAYQLGGKRALSEKSGISEAQLYRYRNGSSQPTQRNILKLAEAGNVTPQWLLTGQSPAAMPHIAQHEQHQHLLLSTLLEHTTHALNAYDDYKALKPLQHKIVPLMYQALRHEPQWQTELPEQGHILHMLNYLISFSSLSILDVLSDIFFQLTDDKQKPVQDISSAINQICHASSSYYNTRTGHHYFERLGQSVWPNSVARITHLVEQATQILQPTEGITWLDVGCGSGREMSYMYRHFPHIQVRGVEPSAESVQRAHKLEAAEKLPHGAVREGDARHLPFKSNSFDVVYSRAVLMHLPYIPGCQVGAPEMIKEALRVLKPGGLLSITTPHGNWHSLLPYHQAYNLQQLQQLVEQSTFKTKLLEGKPFDNPPPVTHNGQIQEQLVPQITALFQKSY